MKVTFYITYNTVWGEELCLTGSTPSLGNWDEKLAIAMHYLQDGVWHLCLDLLDQEVEYSYFVRSKENIIKESGTATRKLLLEKQSNPLTLMDYWRTEKEARPYFSSAFTSCWFALDKAKTKRVALPDQRVTLRVFAPFLKQHEKIVLVGDQTILGNWLVPMGITLDGSKHPVWECTLDRAMLTDSVEYKFVIHDGINPARWEMGDNRKLSVSRTDDMICSDLIFRENMPTQWRCAGTAIPLFSLRSSQSFGVGDFGDLRLFVNWAKQTKQRIIQLLPINDTIQSHTWKDSYPYSAISIYATHPMYLCFSDLPALKNRTLHKEFMAKRLALNALDTVDYEHVVELKMHYAAALYDQIGERLLKSEPYAAFYQQNEHWLVPYAAYCFLRDKYHTSDFSQWEVYAQYDKKTVAHLCSSEGEAFETVRLLCFIQYLLHHQFLEVCEYASKQGIVLKGDLPIGVSRTGVEAWTEPALFNMHGQAGAPPDDFSLLGQNWGFPTYNWTVMEEEHFRWWKARFSHLSTYFDAFRIDHILGFFRIWEIPLDYIEGLCGHFSPALPLSREEISTYGFTFEKQKYTIPHIHRNDIEAMFGLYSMEVMDKYLLEVSNGYFILHPYCNTQRKIADLFAKKRDDVSEEIRKGLFAIANEVLFVEDPIQTDHYHPRIVAERSFVYRNLTAKNKSAFDRLYRDFFYYRHNDFWKKEALRKLIPLIKNTQMLVCGEDLGMIPHAVPEVMNALEILSLEIERMPKDANQLFTNLMTLPYLSVCTTSTHDMSPIRCWWEEDMEKTQRYYNLVLKHAGEAPLVCTQWLCQEIITNHLNAPSMMTIIPLQDWFALDDEIKHRDCDSERINVPSNPNHYWRYRMHIDLEQLLRAERLNNLIEELITQSNRW